MSVDLLVVGAGLAGCTVAERVAAELGWEVLVIDRRPELGGNSADGVDAAGIMVQKHGPHIFHTRLTEVWHYLNRFARFNDYVHRVLARINGMEVYLPLNLETGEALFHRAFTPDSWRGFLAARRLPIGEIRNSRDVALSQVGEELFEWIFRGYTRKQWGVEPEELAPEVLARIPLRFDRDTRYFTDPYQGIPVAGYTAMAAAMLDSPRIRVRLLTEYASLRHVLKPRLTVFTGPIDEYFDYRQGALPYRSLRFEWQTLDQEFFQRAAVVNYPQEMDFTRITEYKHFHGQRHPRTTISREYPTGTGEPYYPIPRPANRNLYDAYAERAGREKEVFFVGRLAQYRYLNMDEAVAAGLQLSAEIVKRYR